MNTLTIEEQIEELATISGSRQLTTYQQEWLEQEIDRLELLR